jgi:hypothetical protein
MTPQTPIAPDNKALVPVVPNRLPPEERFWKHYSPHHEFPLSSVTSAALHVLAIVLLLLSAWVAWKLGFANLNQPPEVTAVALEEAGGGGGNPKGLGPSPGQVPQEEGSQTTDPKPPVDDPKLKDLNVKDPDPLDLLKRTDDKEGRPVREGGQALQALEKIDQSIRKEWFKGLGDKGQGGPGHGGGEGHGEGTGSGNDKGPGSGTLSKRQKRFLRWSMLVGDHISGDEYARRLQNVRPGRGAILAYPTPDGRQYYVIRDLSKRPAVGQIEDITKLTTHDWIWADERPESVANLAQTLQLPKVPGIIVAFLPPEFEAELAKIEHDYKNLEEDQIEETKFGVVASADGYKPVVLSQTPKR